MAQRRSARAKAGSEDAAAVLRAASDLVQRFQFANRAGLAFQDPNTGAILRNVHQTLGYLPNPTVEQYRARYEREGIAKRIVEAEPRSTWIAGVDIQENDDPKVETPFEKAVNEMVKKFDLWATLCRLDILAGIGRYGVLLIGGPGALELPLTSLGKKLAYLTPMGEDRATIAQFDEKPESPRFGEPEFYQCSLVEGRASYRVHYSRILHFADNPLDATIYGEPRLRAVWNYLDDLLKVVGGGAEASYRRADPGLQIDIDPKIEVSATQKEELKKQVDEYVHNLRRVLQTRGTTVNPLHSAVPSFGPNGDFVLSLIAGTRGLPKRILIGTESGELASTQDRTNWADRTTERQLQTGTKLVRNFVDLMIELKALPTPAGDYEVIWPEADGLEESERAAIAATIANANGATLAAEGTILMTADEIRDRLWGLEPLVWEPPPLPEPPPGEDDPDGEGEGDDGEEGGKRSEGEPGGKGGVPSGAPKAALRAARGIPPRLRGIWDRQEAVAKANEARVARAVQAWWALAVSKLDFAQITELAKAGNLPAVEMLTVLALQGAAKERTKAFERLGLDLLSHGASIALSTTTRGTKRGNLRGAALSMQFDAKRPTAQQWAKQWAAELIREVSKGTKRAVAELVAETIDDGEGVESLARDIRNVVGLRSDQRRAVERFREAGASPKQVDRYSAKLRGQRARLIARTETARSMNAGQQQLWNQAVDSGQLPKDSFKVWIATPDDRVRPEHWQMNGQVVPVGDKFIKYDADGNETEERIDPGEEPNCRCAHAIADDEDIAAFFNQQETGQPLPPPELDEEPIVLVPPPGEDDEEDAESA